ncbi:MAG: sec-independent protein translocase protein TatC [Saprospiraceae bacterium]|jgi:sec-independent protein translocase protein TatC
MKKIGKKDGQKEEKEMSFLEHIEELRWHLIRSIGAIFIFGIAVFMAKDFVTEILFAPRYNSFITHRLLCQYLNSHCDVPSFEIITRELGEEFFVHLKSSVFLAVILTFPYLFWEVWRFIKPGLYDKERKAARGIVLVCSSLFFLGVLFGYYIIAPFSISFLAGYSFGEGNADTATLGSYVGYITMITLPTGLVFELPIVAYFLGKVGLISSGLMKKFRRHAIVVIFILAAVITPPDLMTQLLIAIPLLGLYEVSISIVKRIEKKHEAEFGSASE